LNTSAYQLTFPLLDTQSSSSFKWWWYHYQIKYKCDNSVRLHWVRRHGL